MNIVHTEPISIYMALTAYWKKSHDNRQLKYQTHSAKTEQKEIENKRN